MTKDEQAIRSAIDAWCQASATGDVAIMLTLLADDMLFIVPGAPPFGKQEFKAAWEGPMRDARVNADASVEEILVNGDFAVTRVKLSVSITLPDGNISRASGYTMTLFRRQPDGRWVMARDANLLTPEP